VQIQGTWRSVATGEGHSCAIRADGSAWCWGANQAGQLGRPAFQTEDLAPARVGDFTDWSQLAVSSTASCGVREDGVVWCWGGNNLIFGMGDSQPTPTRIDLPAKAVQLAGHYYGLCARLEDGAVWCTQYEGWPAKPFARFSARSVVDLTVNVWGVCELRDDGSLWCTDWRTPNPPSPVQVGPGLDWVGPFSGAYSTCGLRRGGVVSCFGDHDAIGGAVVDVALRAPAIDLASGDQSSCAMFEDRSVWCWGMARFLGIGRDTDELLPPTAVIRLR
jgi:hypothetical protein